MDPAQLTVAQVWIWLPVLWFAMGSANTSAMSAMRLVSRNPPLLRKSGCRMSQPDPPAAATRIGSRLYSLAYNSRYWIARVAVFIRGGINARLQGVAVFDRGHRDAGAEAIVEQGRIDPGLVADSPRKSGSATILVNATPWPACRKLRLRPHVSRG